MGVDASSCRWHDEWELDAASDIASGPAVVTGLRTEQALWTVVVELAGTAGHSMS